MNRTLYYRLKEAKYEDSLSEFLDKISTAKFDAKIECKKSRLAPKEYVHSIGAWDRYIRFIKKKIKEG